MAGFGSGDSCKQILRDRYEIQQRLGKKAGRQMLLACADLPQKDMQIQFEQDARLSHSLVALMTAPSLGHRYSSVRAALGDLKVLFFSKESQRSSGFSLKKARRTTSYFVKKIYVFNEQSFTYS